MSTATETEIKAPRGVSGHQRDLFLSLTHEQRKTYRHHFDACGRPAWLAHRLTTKGF